MKAMHMEHSLTDTTTLTYVAISVFMNIVLDPFTFKVAPVIAALQDVLHTNS